MPVLYKRKTVPRPSARCLFDSYWGEGMSLNTIANGCGVSHATVIYWFKHYKIPTRCKGDAQRVYRALTPEIKQARLHEIIERDNIQFSE